MHRAALRLSLVVVGVYAAMALAQLVSHDGRLDSFVRFGWDDPTITVAREKLGADVVPTSGEGFDGQYFWLQAHDPLLLDPSLYRRASPAPAYRTPRMLYPLLVSPALVGGESALMAAMVVVNLLVVGAGTYVTARLCGDLGAPAAGGLCFALSPGVLTGTFQVVADPLALLGIVAAVWALRRGRWGWAALAAGAAVASKEFSLLSIVGLAVCTPSIPWRRRLAVGAAGAGTLAAILAYVRLRFGENTPSNTLAKVPFGGFADAWRYDWSINASWFDAVGSVAVVAAGGWALVRWWRRRTPELAIALPMALAVPFLSGEVVRYVFNLARVAGPVVLGLAVDVYAGQHQRDAARRSVGAAT